MGMGYNRTVRQQPSVGKMWNAEGSRGRQAGSGSPRRCLGCRTILLRRPTGVTLRHLGSQWDRVSSRQECVHSFPPQLFLSPSAKSRVPHRFRHARRIHLLAAKSIADYLISTIRPSRRDSRTLLTLKSRDFRSLDRPDRQATRNSQTPSFTSAFLYQSACQSL